MIIREMIEGDLNQASEVFYSAFREEADIPEVPKEEMKIAFNKNDQNNIHLVAQENGLVVGYIMGTVHYMCFELNPYMTIWGVSVKDSARNKGVGTALVEEIITVARKIGCEEIWLFTNNKNAKAQHLYEKLGFYNNYRGYLKLQSL